MFWTKPQKLDLPWSVCSGEPEGDLAGPKQSVTERLRQPVNEEPSVLM